MKKLITFAVPCYNSAAYMERCVESLLTGGEAVEIILIDDGSDKDETPVICDRYAAQYPHLIRTLHQENGGHGEGVNQGLRYAQGLYFKVVDSDDWLDEAALEKLLDKLRMFSEMEKPVDLVIANYVYEHIEDQTQRVMRYANVFPQDKIITWDQIRRFHPSQYMMMHSLTYRTQLLRTCGLVLPKHTFYEDNLFVYRPLPEVEDLYYMDVDLYRYLIGRADQSVNESVMVARIDHQLLVNKLMIDQPDLRRVCAENKRLGQYMTKHLAMVMNISSVFLVMDGSPEAQQKRADLWEYLRSRDPALCRQLKHRSIAVVGTLPGALGRKMSVFLYRLAQRIFKFN